MGKNRVDIIMNSSMTARALEAEHMYGRGRGGRAASYVWEGVYGRGCS